MKILFESYLYNTETLKTILSDRYYSYHDHYRSRIEYVGYYFNTDINDAVFILPKVFIYNKGKAFGLWNPEEIVNCTPEIMDELHSHGKGEVIFNLSVWLYQAMVTFRKRNRESEIVKEDYTNNIVSNLSETSTSILDIILSLIKFYKENKSLFTQITKLVHSQKHQTDWGKTISKKQPFICNKAPLYTEVVSKKKTINLNEEIIVIFYSVLKYLRRNYGFNLSTNEHYELIEKRNFEKLLDRGTRELRSIRYKYFSDKLVALWKLLYTYFEQSEQIRSGKMKEEVLLVKNFNIVFEDMVDDLIEDHNIPSYLKKQKDGKQLDHIYRYASLIKNDDIYFVGDSKYYKPDNTVKGQSIDKQYTYAKNVIQYNIDLFNNGKLNKGIRYRDDLTEGYNITPNFFITAFVNEDFNFSLDGLEASENNSHLNYHFKNRLFDRDTLLLQTYNINFLFVISAYISRNTQIKDSFKTKAKSKFRDRMLTYLNRGYLFYKITPEEDIESFITQNFRLLNGKIYRPSDMEKSFILSIENISQNDILDNIKGVFTHEDFILE